MSGLKRLGFVQSGSTAAYASAESIYSKLRSYTPAFAVASVAAVEDRVVAAAAPLVAHVQDHASQLLLVADGKVDGLLTMVDTKYAAVAQLHQSNMASFRAASDRTYSTMTATADAAVEKLHLRGALGAVEGTCTSTLASVKAGRDRIYAAVAKARDTATDPDAAVAAAADAWASFTAIPTIAKLLDAASPATTAGMSYFAKLHTSVVSAPLYKVMLDTTCSAMGYATTTTPYKLGATYMYPIVKPVADPTIAKVTQSKVANTMVDYWKPAQMQM